MVLDKGNYLEYGFIPTVEDWNIFLENWNTEIFENLNAKFIEQYSYEFSEVLENECCLWEGATEDDISKLEERLRTKLPLGYKNFLLASNGFTILNRYCELYGTDQIKWFIEENKEWVEIWNGDEDRIDEDWAEIWGIDSDEDDIDEDDISDEEYIQYGDDPLLTRSQYMKTALQISSTRDGDVFLLNPIIKDARNEWEAWDFGNKNPGAFRYHSFWDMMQELYKQKF
ncbi:SMI1/KNR4 family protein [Pseudanabaena sp. UWO310]|uniref:SMI1/KNR4 family protein n=1 Tax=Pseudanabaena sp. UWO310 TaxID=2480795 RepID=UPI001157456C|nr:SMI1/KNR4 family protein [Pseudanabaena sp. UWO310]TYQ31014.1 SMI1/KNR4 family protein [Pseudanabaena sp. UWO310]